MGQYALKPVLRRGFGGRKVLSSGPRQQVEWLGFGWAQVAERLMAADCKSAALWSYGGSNPPLCTTWMVGTGIGREWAQIRIAKR